MANVFIDLPALTLVGGIVTVNQGTTPWIVDGSGYTQPISAVSLPLPTGASTLSEQQSQTTLLSSINVKLTNPIPVTGPLTDAQLRASPVPVSGTVAISGGTISATQGTSPWVVSGTVLVDQNTSPWIISGTVAATQSGAWTTGRTWTLSSGTDSVSAVQSGTWNIGTVTSITNVVHVDDNGGSLTVDNNGTFLVQAQQSGTWNINDITGTISLPTGAATSANQTNNLQRTQLVNSSGNSAAVQTLGTTPVSGDFGILTNSLIYGLTTGGGGGYVPVKVNPSGTMTVDATGTVAVTQATASNLNAQVVGNVANAATDSGNPVKVAAVYNTTAPTYSDGQRTNLQSDIRGSLFVNTEGRKKTYSASIAVLTVGTLTTDFFTITGANGVIVRIQSIQLTAEATNNSVPEVILLKRSSANTGGTSTTVTAVPHDSNDAAASATVTAYTANPTTGALVGNLRATDLFFSGGAGLSPQLWDIDFTSQSAKTPRLNSSSEVIALNLNGVTVAGANFAINITWTEE